MNKIETTPHATTRELVENSLSKIGYTFNPQGGWMLERDGISHSDPPSIMASKIREHLERNKSKYVPAKDAIICAIELLEYNRRSEYSDQCWRDIKHNPSAKDTSDELAKLIAGDNYHAIYPHILRQVLWSVKSKMLGRKVKCPILTIFYGKAGVGKSTLVQALCAPLPSHKVSFIKDGDNLINKEKSTQLIAESLILHLDEMSGMTKADIAKLKTLDAPYLSYVPLYSNTPKMVFNRATLIGCSNTEVRNLLHSTANNRKWVQINFYDPPQDGKEQFKRERIKGITEFDFVNLWQSVNEDAPEPFSDPAIYQSYLEYVEETCTSSTPTTDWLDAYMDEHGGEFVMKTALYEDYRNKCRTDTKHMSKDHFYELCEQKGCKFSRRGINGDRGFVIPSKPQEEEF